MVEGGLLDVILTSLSAARAGMLPVFISSFAQLIRITHTG
jgi:hypothetical protein